MKMIFTRRIEREFPKGEVTWVYYFHRHLPDSFSLYHIANIVPARWFGKIEFLRFRVFDIREGLLRLNKRRDWL